MKFDSSVSLFVRQNVCCKPPSQRLRRWRSALAACPRLSLVVPHRGICSGSRPVCVQWAHISPHRTSSTLTRCLSVRQVVCTDLKELSWPARAHVSVFVSRRSGYIEGNCGKFGLLFFGGGRGAGVYSLLFSWELDTWKVGVSSPYLRCDLRCPPLGFWLESSQ